jgi:probable F420-dependent oxidoreductase
MSGIGLSIPFPGYSLAEHRDVLSEAVDLGYTSVWSSESNSTDAFTPLSVSAAWQPGLALGTSVVPVQTRGPGVLAQCFASLAEATPSRVVAGIGASTPTVVKDWNNTDFDHPYKRVRDTIRFLRSALAGEKVTEKYETFSVEGFRLLRPPTVVPRVMIAAGRQTMLKLAGRDADGAIINWVSPEDVATIAPIVRAAAGEHSTEVVARLFVCPSTDADAVRSAARPFLAQYVTPAGYREFHQWIGRGERLRDVFDLWDRGERRRAAASVSDAVVDEIVIHGSPEQCRETVQAYLDAGLTSASLVALGIGMDEKTAMRRLGPIDGLRTYPNIAN